MAALVACSSARGDGDRGEAQDDPGGDLFASDDADTIDGDAQTASETSPPSDPGDPSGSSDPTPADPSDPSDPSGSSGSGTPSGPTCASGKTACDGVCVDLETNRNHCGGCARKCALNATGCVAGHCTCIDGQHACGTECVNLHWNEANCGSCGHACAAGRLCCDGWCKASC